jgi:hypothetical protein
MPRAAIIVLVLLAATLPGPPVAAQALNVTIGAGAVGAAPVARARVSLLDLRVADDAFDLGVGWLGAAPSAAASWRRTVAAGPVGTLVLDGRAGVDARGAGLAAGVRGTAGPVALRLEIELGTRPPAPFGVLLRAPATAPPPPDGARSTGAAVGSLRADLAAAVTWRRDRLWTVEVAPRLHAGEAGWAGGVAALLRRAAVATDLDVSGRLDLALGAAAGHAAVGLTLHHVPRRAPESRATLWWGGAWSSLAPGVEVSWVAREAGAQLTLAGGWGPAWTDRPQAYGALAVQAPIGAGTAHLGWRWQAEDAGVVDVGWTRPLRR